MSWLTNLVILSSAVFVAYFINSRYSLLRFSIDDHQNIIKNVPKRGYFGAGGSKLDDPKIVPFKVNVPDSDLEDLKTRLGRARFYENLEKVAFNYGMDMKWLKKLQNYWLNTFDWRQQEAKLNAFDQFKTQIEGLDIHFIHAKPPAGRVKSGAYKEVIPLLLVHGWPGSVFEFNKILPMLTDPESQKLASPFAFEVVAPSIPGYGWSEASSKPGFNTLAAARIFKKLMERLGHKRYYVQGGDWGSMIVAQMAAFYPQSVRGMHSNMPIVDIQAYPMLAAKYMLGSLAPHLVLPPQDADKMYPIGSLFVRLVRESGYMHIQATKPDTVGFALNDSPLGLAAYIIEKFSTWTDPENVNRTDGGLGEKFTLDELLTNVMIYWTTGSIASSQRLYKEEFSDENMQKYGSIPVTVPCGFAVFRHELIRYPRSFLEYRYSNIVRYTDMPRGGHFAAFEEPKLLANDVFLFVLEIEASKLMKEEELD